MTRRVAGLAMLLIASGGVARTPPAIFTDPPRDAAHPARMEVLHVPSGGVEINGVAYLAGGAGPHPTLVICHGLPGNEKNLDLAQAVRRAGWNAITFNYRGSWGSPGAFRFAQVPEDAAAVVAMLQRPEVAARLGVDRERIVLAGHSMGGWATALAAGRGTSLAGAILISAGDMGRYGRTPRAALVTGMAENRESLAGTSPEAMADELAGAGARFDLAAAAPGLARTPLLVLTSDDGGAAASMAFAEAARAAGNGRVTVRHVATDHGWSDRRIALQTLVLDWLRALVPAR